MRISDWSSDVCSSDLREHGVDAVCLAQVEIILAVIGRHMDEAGAAVGGDEIAGEEGARAGVKFQRPFTILVIPVKAGTEGGVRRCLLWLPAFAGMSKVIVARVPGAGAGIGKGEG